METKFMTNENLIRNLCDRANALWLLRGVDTDMDCITITVYLCPEVSQVWFSYRTQTENLPKKFDKYIAEGKDLNSALLDLDNMLSIQEAKENKRLEDQSEQYFEAHRELILSDIGFGD